MNCNCPAYPFPHRPGGGKCQAPKEGQLVCEDCHGACEGTYVDFGIGTYEFWGAKGVDRQVAWASECCEATVLWPSGHRAEPPDTRDEDQPSKWRPHA